MPLPTRLEVSQQEREALEQMRDHHSKGYARERAAALLKIADSASATQVAYTGLLKERYAHAVCEWVRRYKAEGIAGLLMREGRGRKPSFSPQIPTNKAATTAMLNLVRREPCLFGHERSRWTLHMLLDSCDELGLIARERLGSLPGLHQLLERLGINLKRARSHIYSPDPHYLDKQAEVERSIEEAEGSEGKIVLVYMDQVTTYRQPTLAPSYEFKGHVQPLAERSYHSDTITRIVGSLEHSTGKVVYLRASRIGISQMVEFYQKLRHAYPDAERIYVVQDNWPVHVHPDLLVALEPQTTPWLRATPPNWPLTPSKAAVRKWGHLQLPIQAGASTHLCKLAQSYREAVALSQTRPAAPAQDG